MAEFIRLTGTTGKQFLQDVNNIDRFAEDTDEDGDHVVIFLKNGRTILIKTDICIIESRLEDLNK